MRTKIGTFALTILMVTVGLATIAPPAAASFACMPLVQVDQNHSPSGIWTTHIHPRFTFPISNPYGCDEVTTEVRESWRGSFTTNADDYHPQLGSGEFYIQARVLYKVIAWEYFLHCHQWVAGVCVEEHWHSTLVWRDVWTGWVTSPTVKIDVVAPHVEVAGISEPFVQGPDADYLTNETEITLAASDAHSGVNRIEYRLDDGDWQVYNGPTTITGDNGPHTFTYRAIDNVGLQTVKSREFILDNTTPEQTMIRPNASSVTYGDHAVETCNGTIRVTEGGGEVVAAPDHNEAVDNVTAAAGRHLPPAPETPDVVNTGPNACTGQVVETTALPVAIPTEELDPVLGAIAPYRDQVVQAAEDGRDHLPEEVDQTIGQFLDEQPEAPDDVTVDGQDVDYEPVYLVSGTVELELDVQDAWVGTANVSFLVDDEVHETQPNGDGVYVFQWDTTGVPTGSHEVTLQATDRLGNQGQWTFPMWVVSTTAPAPDPEDIEPPVEVPELPA